MNSASGFKKYSSGFDFKKDAITMKDGNFSPSNMDFSVDFTDANFTLSNLMGSISEGVPNIKKDKKDFKYIKDVDSERGKMINAIVFGRDFNPDNMKIHFEENSHQDNKRKKV